MIQFTDVTKSYAKGSEPAVAGLSLTVGRGEIYGFLGPNGAGKTTTIKMIVGLLRPDAGSITINGFDIQRDPLAAKRQIGYVPDTPALWDKLTGIEYLGFVGDVFAIPAETRRQRIEQLSEAFEIKGALGEQLGAYSHGMQQKVLLLGALLHQPPVWVLDEPMVGLDPRTAHVLKDLMAEHCSKGNTVFFSTHILDVAERLCHRVGIIRKGRLIAEGSLADLRAKQGEGTLEQIFLELTEA